MWDADGTGLAISFFSRQSVWSRLDLWPIPISPFRLQVAQYFTEYAHRTHRIPTWYKRIQYHCELVTVLTPNSQGGVAFCSTKRNPVGSDSLTRSTVSRILFVQVLGRPDSEFTSQSAGYYVLLYQTARLRHARPGSGE